MCACGCNCHSLKLNSICTILAFAWKAKAKLSNCGKCSIWNIIPSKTKCIWNCDRYFLYVFVYVCSMWWIAIQSDLRWNSSHFHFVSKFVCLLLPFYFPSLLSTVENSKIYRMHTFGGWVHLCTNNMFVCLFVCSCLHSFPRNSDKKRWQGTKIYATTLVSFLQFCSELW